MKRFFIFLFILCIIISSLADEIINETNEEIIDNSITESIEEMEYISDEELLEYNEDPLEDNEELSLEDSEESPIEILPIESISIEFDTSSEDEVITIEQHNEEDDMPHSVAFHSSHSGKIVEEGTKITLTVSTEGIPDDIEIIWEYSDDGGMTAHEFASGVSCSIIASKENENRLYRAIVRLP